MHDSTGEIKGSEDGMSVEPALQDRLAGLCHEGWEIFEQFSRSSVEDEFHPFVAAEYEVVQAVLVRFRGEGLKFLEWGSATGVITICLLYTSPSPRDP